MDLTSLFHILYYYSSWRLVLERKGIKGWKHLIFFVFYFLIQVWGIQKPMTVCCDWCGARCLCRRVTGGGQVQVQVMIQDRQPPVSGVNISITLPHIICIIIMDPSLLYQILRCTIPSFIMNKEYNWLIYIQIWLLPTTVFAYLSWL